MNEIEENFLTQFLDSKSIQEANPTKLLDFSPNGEHFSYVVNDSLKIYTAKNGVLKNIISAPMDAMCYFQNNTLIHSKDNNLFYLSIYDNTYLRSFESHSDKIQSISVNSVSDTFLSCSNESVKFWDIRYKDPIFSFDSKGRIGALSRENTFALADSNFIYIYDPRNASHPLEAKPIKSNFYKKISYTADSSVICMSTLKSNLFLDKNGDYLTELNLENECDGCCINDSNVFLCGSLKNLLAFKIQDKKKIGRLFTESVDVSVVRSNPYYSQFIIGSENSFKVFNRVEGKKWNE